MRKLIIFTAISFLSLFSNMASAASDAHFDTAPLNINDKDSLRNGAKIFMNYCSGCHSLEFQRYSRTARDLEIPAKIMTENLIFTGSYSTRDAEFKPTVVGDLMKTAMSRKDAKYWFGAEPLDLSVIVRAKGADYIYTYLRTFYVDPTRPLGVNNIAFPSVGMPHVLLDLQGLQKPVYKEILPAGCKEESAECKSQKVVVAVEPLTEGSMTAKEYNRTVGDLVNFLNYISEPVQIERANYGLYVILFLLIFTGFTYVLNREYWKNIH